jgi:NAD dependent epimerase/dehydratase
MENWVGRKVLVTGAGGFIGSHLVERLVDKGAKVRAFVRYNSRNDWGYIDLIPRDKFNQVEVIAGDLRDSDAIRQAMKEMEVVFHLGSLIAITYSYTHPRETIETNIMGALNILSAARDTGVEKIVHTSTSEVYGTAQYVPIDEKHPLQGQSPYSASKIGADMIADSFYRSFGVPVAIIRPFNTYGPRQSARAVIPSLISQALSGKKIFLGSTAPTRDFTFVTDTANAFIKVAESSNSTGQIINVGSNFEISIGDIARKIIDIVGRNNELELDEKRVRPAKSEVERLWCDNSRAKRILGWEPEVKFEEGLKRTVEWITANLNLYKPGIYNV